MIDRSVGERLAQIFETAWFSEKADREFEASARKLQETLDGLSTISSTLGASIDGFTASADTNAASAAAGDQIAELAGALCTAPR
ncbi:hypothetical protein [Ovoidimarina sediminis]|uniref:hypothetical protein n=1 Tax=Ovoidimarina sediminis TaxID=3079856 RepID=UPI002909D6A9|nr:hypothetical protein [Rhodophyticola sp. MJ-SS7]MDU8944081.1 hypothetical protein [Rhodophyticola sp. MJ-SS7]